MSINQWLMLWILFLSYLFLGAFVFYATERRYEETRRIRDSPEKLNIEELLDEYYTWTNRRAHKQLLLKLRQNCNASMLRPILQLEAMIEREDEYQWTFFNSFFFALTTLSTIGYGNLHPTSCLGRMLVIVYSLVGIPLNGIVLTQLGDFFASTFLRVHQRYKNKRFETRFNLLLDIATYLVPGILIFIFLPSGFFVYFEGWTFEESIYFAFVTLTTIGFGDLVAGQSTTEAIWYHVYKVMLIFWIMFGLGYLVMILGFISRAMRCKKVARLERKLAHNLRHTHSKILNEFTRDVSYVRRLLNELYLLKYEPVYQNKQEEHVPFERQRTQSAPNLSEWPTLSKTATSLYYSSSEDEEETMLMFEKQRMKRRQALSENLFKHENLKTRSESDLTKIDKDATFNNPAYVERNRLMAKMSDAFEKTYSQMRQAQSLNLEISSDEEKCTPRKVSSFERELRNFDVSSNDTILFSISRDECFENKRPEYGYSEQWTWPGSESIADKRMHQLRLPTSNTNSREQRRSIPVLGVQNLRRMSIAAINFLTPSIFVNNTGKDDDASKDIESGKLKERLDRTRHSGRISSPRKERYSLCDDYENVYDYLNYYTQMRIKDANIFSALRDEISNIGSTNPVLEQTSIGDFLRLANSIGMNNCSTPETTTLADSTLLFNSLQDEMFSTDETVRRMRQFGRSCSAVMTKEHRYDEHRRYSAVPVSTKPVNVVRNRSFSSYSRNMSTSKFSTSGERSVSSQTLAIPQIRRIRSEFLSKSTPDDSNIRRSTRRIKRFLVKPVALPITPLPQRLNTDEEQDQEIGGCDSEKTDITKL